MPVKKVEETTDPWSDTMTVDFPEKPEQFPPRDLITITMKAGDGFGVPWHVLHASSMEEAVEILEHDDYPHLVDLTVARSRELAKAYGGSGGTSRSSTGGGWAGKAKSPSKGSHSGSGDRDECEHGERVLKSGVSSRGPWKGFFCPSRVCDPIFE